MVYVSSFQINFAHFISVLYIITYTYNLLTNTSGLVDSFLIKTSTSPRTRSLK